MDYTPIFKRGRYTEPLSTYKRLCDLYVKSDTPNEVIDMNKDHNIVLAADVLSRKLNDLNLLNRIGEKAIKQNLEVAKKYTSQEDLTELDTEP